MDPITLVVLAGVGALALAKKPAPGTKNKKAHDVERELVKSQKGDERISTGTRFGTGGAAEQAATGGLITAAAGGAAIAIGGAGVVSAAAGASIAAGFAVGSQISGTTAGGIVGAVNPVFGNVFNTGAQAGRELHRLFGGDGQSSLTGVLAQAVGGATSLIASLFGAFAAFGFFWVGAILFGIGTIVEDENRLAFGKAGARDAWLAEWKNVYDKYRGNLDFTHPADSTSDRDRYATALTHGHMNRVNHSRWQTWTKKPMGIGVDDAYAQKFGAERGYWYCVGGSGEYDPENTWEPFVPWHPKARTWWTEVQAEGANAITAWKNAIEVGDVTANLGNYLFAAQQPPGAGKSLGAHLRYWLEGGYFDGWVELATGVLVYKNHSYLVTEDLRGVSSLDLETAAVVPSPTPKAAATATLAPAPTGVRYAVIA